MSKFLQFGALVPFLLLSGAASYMVSSEKFLKGICLNICHIFCVAHLCTIVRENKRFFPKTDELRIRTNHITIKDKKKQKLFWAVGNTHDVVPSR